MMNMLYAHIYTYECMYIVICFVLYHFKYNNKSTHEILSVHLRESNTFTDISCR